MIGRLSGHPLIGAIAGDLVIEKLRQSGWMEASRPTEMNPYASSTGRAGGVRSDQSGPSNPNVARRDHTHPIDVWSECAQTWLV